ncbi:hypothetical protein ABLE92_16035 [Gordonia sp. VNQ95]|uniref:hypothetical protein n=1 Tax=unclassified Gordonia (in: high G+C Gram-positive bacteria) TaxID=2657482 RepID=UPI0032B3F7DB
MVDGGAYEKSLLDLGALGELARLAARDTPLPPTPALSFTNPETRESIQVLGPHWALDHQATTRRALAPLSEDNEYVDVVIALLPDGTLQRIRVIQSTFATGSGSPTYTDEPDVRPVTEADVERLDFSMVRSVEPPVENYEDWGMNEKLGFWGTRRGRDVVGSALVHRSRGAGLAHVLNSVRSGTLAALPKPVRLHDVPASMRPLGDPKGSESVKMQRKVSLGRAFSLLGSRALVAIGVWMALGLLILASNNVGDDPAFAEGSYTDVAWSLVCTLILGFLIDVFIGIGKGQTFVVGALVGIALFLYVAVYRAGLWDEFVGPTPATPTPMDLSMFWVAPIAGLVGYLLSSLLVNRHQVHG